MAVYDRQKERVRETFSAGFPNTGQTSVFPTSGAFLENGCMTRVTESIDYGVGRGFNPCLAQKSTEVIGIAADRCTFGQMTCQVRPGVPPSESGPGSPPMPHLLDSVIVCQFLGGPERQLSADEELAQARFDAYQKLIYLVPNEHMNIARSLIELKDTKSTIKPLVDLTKWGRHVAQKGGVFLKVGSKKVWKKVSLLSSMASMAHAYLWYTFGVEPTVSDVKTFIRQTSSGTLRVLGSKQRLIPKGSVMVQRYTAMPKACQVGSIMFEGASTAWGGDGTVKRVVAKEIRLPNYTQYFHWPSLTPSYTFPFSQAHRVRTFGYRGCYFAEVLRDIVIDSGKDLETRMKWNCPLGASLWELTPFSFIVDWFANIGQYIENLDHLAMGISYRTSLGPIWESSQRVTEIWRPALEHVGFQALKWPTAPSDGSYGGLLTFEGVWRAKPKREDRTVSYERTVRPAPSLPPLTVSDEVKAYQISSGMALLVQFANGLR